MSHLIQTFLWRATSVADAAAVNPNGVKTLSANGLSTFPINNNPVFVNGPKNYLKNLIFDNFILADEPFAKPLWSFETCVLINNNLSGKFHS